VLQCKKECVNYYQSKLASLNVRNERRVPELDISDVVIKSLETHGQQSQYDENVDGEMSTQSATSLQITPARKRTQTTSAMKLTTRKSARLAGKNA